MAFFASIPQTSLAEPTFSVASGTYFNDLHVVVTIATPATIHYTQNGLDPTESDPVIASGAHVVVDRSQILKARAFKVGFDPSATTTHAYTLKVGAPAISPLAGNYADPFTASIAPAAGVTWRYTTDGADPTTSSSEFSGALNVTAATTFHVAGFRDGWSRSDVLVVTYTIDSSDPTITAHRFPSPIASWHMTPVTVSFRCADNIEVASCSAPTEITAEGADQQVSGTAVDTAGRQNTITETISLDLTPPVVTLTSPQDLSTTTSTTITIAGLVSDALSGLVAVKCNNVDAAVVDGQATCTVSVSRGRNLIALTARDAAGHSTSAAVTITRVGTPISFRLTPSSRTMLVSETSTLSLRDNFGMPILGAQWASSNQSVVSLSSDDPPVLMAVAEGIANISATNGSLTGQATITVVAGDVLSDGTTRWIVPPTPGSNIRTDPPIYTYPIDLSSPNLFTVETNTTTSVRTVRAVTRSGEVQWIMTSPGVPLMGDVFGGLIAGVEEPTSRCRAEFGEFKRCYTALARFAGPANTLSWRYESSYRVDRPAQGPDGTVYFIENGLGSYDYIRTIVILNGATGQVTARIPLDNFVSDQRSTNPFCENYVETEPLTVGPIVGGDGFGYVAVAKRKHQQQLLDDCSTIVQHETEVGLTLLRLSASGQAGAEVIDDRHCSGCFELRPQQLLPDGIGGKLLVVEIPETERRVIRLDAEGGRADIVIPLQTRIELVGQNGSAYLHRKNGTISLEKKVVDVRNWTTTWNLPVDWNWLAAAYNGDGFAEKNGQVARFGPTGQRTAATPLNLINPVQAFGSWLGNLTVSNVPTGDISAVAMTSYDATRWNESYRLLSSSSEVLRGYGSLQQQRAPSKPCAECQKDYHAPVGKGPAYSIPGVPPEDDRRIITVAIDQSWDTSPGSGTTHPRIWNATACAVNMWNLATDTFGKKTGFYFVIDQQHGRGEPDVIIKQTECSSANSGGTWACSAFPFDDASFQTEMRLPFKNVTTSGITDQELCGRVAHELAHKLGGHATGTCYTQSTILYGTNRTTGKRQHNSVMPVDVEVVNQALNQPATCMGVGPVTEPEEEIASRVKEPTSFFGSDTVVALATLPLVPNPNTKSAQKRGFDYGGEPSMLFLVVLIAALFCGCGDRVTSTSSPQSTSTSAAPKGYLSELASKAKSRGLSTATVNETIEKDTSSSLDEALMNSGLLIATTTGRSAVAATADHITTWEQLHVQEWIKRDAKPLDKDHCRDSAPEAPLTDDTVTVPIAKGTITIDGVSVSVLTESMLDLEVGREYLMFVKECPNRHIGLTYSFNSVFIVGKDGGLFLPTFNEPVAPFVKQLIELSNLDGLRQRIARHP